GSRRETCALQCTPKIDEALKIGNEPDVTQRQKLGDGQVRVADGPAELRANLIDGAQERVVERRRLVRRNCHRLQQPQMLLILIKRTRGVLGDRVSGLPRAAMAV